MAPNIIELTVRNSHDAPHGIARVVLEDGTHRTISAARGGRAFETACSILANTPVIIPLWDETAEELARVCVRVVAIRQELLGAEAELTEALAEHSPASATTRHAVQSLFEAIALSLEVFEIARTVIEGIQSSREAEAYAKSPISQVIEDATRRLACVLGTVSLRAGLRGIGVKPEANGVAIDLPAGGAPLKDPHWAAHATEIWVAASASLSRWWLDFWPSMREVQDHPGLTAGERESLSRIVGVHASRALH